MPIGEEYTNTGPPSASGLLVAQTTKASVKPATPPGSGIYVNKINTKMPK